MQKNWKKKGGRIRKFLNGFVVLLLLLSVGFSCSLVFAEGLIQERSEDDQTEQVTEPESTGTTESSTIESSNAEESSEIISEEHGVEGTYETTEQTEEIKEPAIGTEPEEVLTPEQVETEAPLQLNQAAGLSNSVAVISGGVTQDITLEEPNFNPSLVYAEAGDTLRFNVVFTRPSDVNVKSYTMTMSFGKRANYQKSDGYLVTLKRSYPDISGSDQISYNSWDPTGEGAEIKAFQTTSDNPVKSDIVFTVELDLKSNLTGFDLMSFQTNLSVDLETLGRQQYTDSSYYWINLKDDQPTELSWNSASLEEYKTTASHEISESLMTTFYWKDPDTMAAYLPDGFILEDGSGYQHKVMRDSNDINSGTVTIPLNDYLKTKKPYGTNYLTVKAYKEDGSGGTKVVSNTITLELTVIGSISWVEVTDKINWTLTAGQETTTPLAREEALNVKVKDSRSDSDRASSPWKLSVSAVQNGLEAHPFSLVWQNTGEAPSDLNDTGSIVYTSGSDLTTPDPQQPFVFQKNWQTDEGILLKLNGAPEIGRVYEEPITVNWTLVDVNHGT